MLIEILLILIVLVVLFPRVRRMLSRTGWVLLGAAVLFLIVASLARQG
jgi:hypothetical protein